MSGNFITQACSLRVTTLQQPPDAAAWMAKLRAMFSMLDGLPPQVLQTLYDRLSRRYGAPGVRLLDFPGRWMVFRTVDLAAGLERALIDLEPPLHHTAKDLAELESRAEFAVGDGHDATLVVMYLARVEPPRHEAHAFAPTSVLTIAVWSLAHPMALMGHIDLDEAGTPMWIGAPIIFSKSASRGTQ
jgi:hypothetical protein